jgi:hypothetical protein
MRKEGLFLTVIAIVIVMVFAWPHRDPYRCYIVHHRKDGTCPPGYISGIPFSNYFIEPDGTRQYACLDLRNPNGVGLGKDLCVDFLRPGEKGAYDPKHPPVEWD